MKSAQIPSLILVVYYDDDSVDDCDDGNGHLLKNSPKDVREEFLVGRMTVRCDRPESPGWVRPARQVLIYLLQYVWYMLLMMMMMIVMMIMVNFKRICPKDFREEFLVGRMAVRCDPLESLKWVSRAAKLLELLPLYV